MLPSIGTAIFKPPASGAPSGMEWQATQLPRRATYSPWETPVAWAWAWLSVAKVLGVVTGSELHPVITMNVNTLHVSFFNDMDSPFIIVEDVLCIPGYYCFAL